MRLPRIVTPLLCCLAAVVILIAYDFARVRWAWPTDAPSASTRSASDVLKIEFEQIAPGRGSYYKFRLENQKGQRSVVASLTTGTRGDIVHRTLSPAQVLGLMSELERAGLWTVKNYTPFDHSHETHPSYWLTVDATGSRYQCVYFAGNFFESHARLVAAIDHSIIGQLRRELVARLAEGSELVPHWGERRGRHQGRTCALRSTNFGVHSRNSARTSACFPGQRVASPHACCGAGSSCASASGNL